MRLHERCQAPDCGDDLPEDRQIYCSARCSKRVRMRRYRENPQAYRDMLDRIEEPERTARVSEAFGVETTPAVAFVFADDDARFADARKRGRSDSGSSTTVSRGRREILREYET